VTQAAGPGNAGERVVTPFATKRLPAGADAVAPDGSAVRVLVQTARGSAAHFELAPGATSRAVAHRHVDEIWYFLRGRGEMWRKAGAHEEIVTVAPDVCISLPAGTHFQFRALGAEALAAFGVTMPPWPADGDAYPVEGKWTAQPP
jgi:mannose-6-phosphate isomerase-like protein (cupin superfamily)